MGAVLKEAAKILRGILIDEKQPKLMDTGEPLPAPAAIIKMAIEKETASREAGRVSSSLSLTGGQLFRQQHRLRKLKTCSGQLMAPPEKQEEAPAEATHVYGNMYTKDVIDTDDGETTVAKMLSRISKAIGMEKDFLYAKIRNRDRIALLSEAILRLPEGTYRTAGIKEGISSRLGAFAELDVNERLLQGLSIEFPKRAKVSFTLGLDEVILQNS